MKGIFVDSFTRAKTFFIFLNIYLWTNYAKVMVEKLQNTFRAIGPLIKFGQNLINQTDIESNKFCQIFHKFGNEISEDSFV